jgi:hypothetical protein
MVVIYLFRIFRNYSEFRVMELTTPIPSTSMGACAPSDTSMNCTRIFSALDDLSWAQYTEVCDLMCTLRSHCDHYGFRVAFPIERGGTWVMQTLDEAGCPTFFISFSVISIKTCLLFYHKNINANYQYISDCSGWLCDFLDSSSGKQRHGNVGCALSHHSSRGHQRHDSTS